MLAGWWRDDGDQVGAEAGGAAAGTMRARRNAKLPALHVGELCVSVPERGRLGYFTFLMKMASTPPMMAQMPAK